MSKQRSEVDESLYEQETDIEHVYNRPDMILSTDEWVERKVDTFDFESKKIVKATTNVPPAVFQLVVEAIANSADHIHRSRLENFPEKPDGEPSIEVTMDRYTITVKNYGLAMPVSVHKKYNVPTPQFLFGNLRSSSNYKGVRTGIGRNGYGVKAVNIFSEPFEIYIANMAVGSSYYQKWWNRMNEFSEPIMKPLKPEETESSVSITFRLNFDRFGFEKDGGYPDVFFGMVAHLVQSISFTTKVTTKFNDLVFNNQHIMDYASYIYSPESLENSLIHYELDHQTEEIVKIDGRLVPKIRKGKKNHVIIPKLETIIIDPSSVPDVGVNSFANGMPTDGGGVHVEALLDQIVPRIVKRINAVKRKEDQKGKKTTRKSAASVSSKPATVKTATASKAGGSGSKSVGIKSTDVRPSITSLLSVRLLDPKFDSQVKSRLCSPVPKISISDEKLEPIFKWKFMERLDAILNGLELRALSKTDGRKVGFIKMESGFDANDAGTKDWKKCVLILVEGLSAMSYTIDYISQFENGRDIYGVIPLRGKLLNTRKATTKKIAGNKEIADIKRTLGLKEGQNNLEGLRYGKLMIMTDADDDGSHIKGLIANVFDHLYTDLLKQGFVVDYRTKYLQATKGKQSIDFYTEYEFREWKEHTPNWKTWKLAYFKGLGTSETEDVILDTKKQKIVELDYDENASDHFEMIFGKTGSDGRKKWLEVVRILKKEPYVLSNKISYSDFFDREFSNYSLMSLSRAIPSMTDGLKHCQRQILWGVMNKWKSTSGPYKEMKVAQLASQVATVVAYHHGETSLANALIVMARDFMGSNNLPLLYPKGQFGSRMYGGEDSASPRYVNTYPSKWLYSVFKREDIPILDRIEDEGTLVEPKSFYPIIPIGIVNGVIGVATGYSTSVVNYNPRDVTEYIIWWVNKILDPTKVNQKTPEIVPSYVGFTGQITLYKDAPFDPKSNLFMGDGVKDETGEAISPADATSMDEELEEEGDAKKKCDIVEFTGKYKYDKRNSEIKVTELPPGKWSINYNKWLQKQQIEKKIRKFKDKSTKTKAEFWIYGMEDPSPKKLGLVKKVSLSNMVFLDMDGIPVKYKTIQDYIEDFCKYRIKIYEKRKRYILVDMERQIIRQEERLRYIEAVMEEKIIVIKRLRKDVKEEMTKMKIDPSLYEDVKLSEFGIEGLKFGKDCMKKLTEEKNTYESLVPAMIWKKELLELNASLKKDKKFDRLHEIEIQYSKK
jgi:DNA topoisomerase-2